MLVDIQNLAHIFAICLVTYKDIILNQIMRQDALNFLLGKSHNAPIYVELLLLSLKLLNIVIGEIDFSIYFDPRLAALGYFLFYFIFRLKFGRNKILCSRDYS